MEKKMETTIVYWGYIGIMEKENGNYYLGCRVSKSSGFSRTLRALTSPNVTGPFQL